ncbi:MAG: hypothetical protein JWM00_414 [Candidatus Saccharibacteria bacterium]|nr:hypothetical protein [Candidatus Saccharibacteria bacterium]
MSKLKKKSAHYLKLLRKESKKSFFAKRYAVVAVGILIATTLYWALLGTQIHAGNADQLANSFLFESDGTFKAATLPDQHTFLLKWPVFLLIKLFGLTSIAFTAVTVAAVLITVGALAYIMHRIERRPLIFGTLCLALASCLLLVPIEPYPGASLPVGMAMITTRNLEYIIFLASLILLIRSQRWLSWRFMTASLLIALLIASDKLFLSVSIGGAVLALIFYATARRWALAKLAAMWLGASIAGTVVATGVLWLINASGITHIASGTIAGPYAFVQTGKEVVLGIVHAMLSLLTNLGANPASDTRLLGTVPSQAAASLTSPRGPGLIINVLIALAGFTAVVYIIRISMQRIKTKKKARTRKAVSPRDEALNISAMLIWSTIAACGAFVISNHYYPVDARYVGIAVFALFISLATFVRSYRFKRPERIVLVGAVIVVSIFMSLGAATSSHNEEKAAHADIAGRNSSILGAIKHHPVDVLVGDYWRVLPIKLAAKTPLAITPLAGCTQSREVLSSHIWQLDLRHHSFAYILTLDRGITDDYPSCSLAQVTKTYGQPNTSVVLSGSLKQPKELLLFYDKGIHKSTPKALTPFSPLVPATVVPIAIESAPYTRCTEPTTMNIVAHEDDDLLFMNPDLLHDIQAGRCIRTVYVTSGDAGTDKYYWLGREMGSEDAYLSMEGLAEDTLWIQRIIKLPGGQFITIANPRGNAKVSLIFMHLPDGNVGGQGFGLSHHESLSYLERGRIPQIHTTDHQSTYSSSQLAEALTTLMETYRPDEIRTQANMVDRRYPADHSDHMAVGRYVKQAYQKYIDNSGAQIISPLVFYVGYPISGMPANVVGEDLAQKQRAFFTYARNDLAVCGSLEQCSHGSAYSSYLKRQYKTDY